MSLPSTKIKKRTSILKFPKILELQKRKTGIRGTNKKARDFGKINTGSTLQIYKTLNKNRLKLAMNKTITCKQTGAIIKSEYNGITKGSQNQGVYSVKINKQKFFVKYATNLATTLNIVGIIHAEKIIKHKWKQKKIKVQVITPHIIYTNVGRNKGIIVTDYFDRKEAINLFENVIKPKKRFQLKPYKHLQTLEVYLKKME